MPIIKMVSKIKMPILALFPVLFAMNPSLRADNLDASPLHGAALEHLLGRWRVEANFFDAPGVSHFEKAIFDVTRDTELKHGNSWIVGIWTGTRTDGSDAFNLRFHYRVDPVTKQNIRVEFGDQGLNPAPPLITEGTDDRVNTVTWRGSLAPNVPFIEVIKFTGRDTFTLNAFTPDEYGFQLLSATARRL